jgi:hypothetical protein
MPSAGAPPGAQATPFAKRLETFGTVCLALGAMELVNCVQRLMAPLYRNAMLTWQKSFMPTTPSGPSMDDVIDGARRFGQRIAPWEAARTVPFLVATVVLIWIAVRLRKGEIEALFAARRWTFAALGVVALSALLQVLVTIPATIEYQKEIVATMAPLPGGTPFDFGAFMSSFTVAISVISLILGVIFLSAWPIAVFVWSGKLLREAHPPSE